MQVNKNFMKCMKCGKTTKLLAEFSKHAKANAGIDWPCMACASIYKANRKPF